MKCLVVLINELPEEEKSSTMLGVVFTDFNESILEMILARLPPAGRRRRHADQLLHLIDN